MVSQPSRPLLSMDCHPDDMITVDLIAPKGSVPAWTPSKLIPLCHKCGTIEVKIQWVEHQKPYEVRCGQRIEDNEHIACTCQRCGYAWKTKPLDKKNDSNT